MAGSCDLKVAETTWVLAVEFALLFQNEYYLGNIPSNEDNSLIGQSLLF
jgi:hypothetical protein